MEENVVSNQEDVSFQEIPTSKQTIEVLWHPYFSDYLLILNEESFKLVQITEEEID